MWNSCFLSTNIPPFLGFVQATIFEGENAKCLLRSQLIWTSLINHWNHFHLIYSVRLLPNKSSHLMIGLQLPFREKKKKFTIGLSMINKCSQEFTLNCGKSIKVMGRIVIVILFSYPLWMIKNIWKMHPLSQPLYILVSVGDLLNQWLGYSPFFVGNILGCFVLWVHLIIKVPKITQDRRHRRNKAGSMEIDSQKENSDTDKSDNPDSRSDSRRDRRPSSQKWALLFSLVKLIEMGISYCNSFGLPCFQRATLASILDLGCGPSTPFLCVLFFSLLNFLCRCLRGDWSCECIMFVK